MPATLTLHAIEPALSKRLAARARREGKSLNQTVKDILAGHLGLRPAGTAEARNDIMRFCGILSKEDAQALHDAQAPFSRIDPEDWN